MRGPPTLAPYDRAVHGGAGVTRPFVLNGDGWLCGRDMEIPAFPGFDNYVDNVVMFTA